MGLAELLLYSVSITLVFTRGSIFLPLRGGEYRARGAESKPVRLFRDWASCPLCAGTWVGLACVLITYGVSGTWSPFRAMMVLGFGCATGALSALAYSLIDFLDEAFRPGSDG